MALVDHLSLGVDDIERARTFYDPVLDAVGAACLDAGDDYAVYGAGRVEFLLLKPFDGGKCSGGNGTHVGFAASSRAAVDAAHAAGLAAGGTNEGAPGERADYPMPGVYAAYLRDTQPARAAGGTRMPEPNVQTVEMTERPAGWRRSMTMTSRCDPSLRRLAFHVASAETPRSKSRVSGRRFGPSGCRWRQRIAKAG